MPPTKAGPSLVDQKVQKKAAPGGEAKAGDQHTIKGKVSRGAIIVQGRNARVEITQVYRDQTPSEAEQEELKGLRAAVLARGEEWREAVAKVEIHENPYHLLQPLECSESANLAGREASVASLLGKLAHQRAVFLTGEEGVGTSSLIRAGLIPELIARGDLPLYMEGSDEPLALSIRRSLVSSPDRFPNLSRRSLEDFLRLATAFLPKDRSLVVMIDDLQHFFAQPPEQQTGFMTEWEACIAPTGPRVRWLFCLPLDQIPNLDRFRPAVNPYADLNVLQRLDQSAARTAVLQPLEGRSIIVDEGVTGDILDRLGPLSINPAELQIVCHSFAIEDGSLREHWSLEDYRALGRADGILNRHLVTELDRFPVSDRQAAWRTLDILSAPHRERASEQWLQSQLASYGEQPANLSALLDRLHLNHLVSLQDGSYRLSSNLLVPRIQEWSQRQAALIEARQEAGRQLQDFRRSAMRGAAGGAVGFAIFRWAVGNPARDPLAIIFFTLLYATIGGLVGMLFAFIADIAAAAFRGPRRVMRLPVLGLAGAAVFALALSLFAYLGSGVDGPHFFYAGLLGGLWGSIAGAGAAWFMNARQGRFWMQLVTAILGALVLVLGNAWLQVLQSKGTLDLLALFLAAGVFTLAVIGSVALRKSSFEWEEGAR
jgi:hypothetical protein